MVDPSPQQTNLKTDISTLLHADITHNQNGLPAPTAANQISFFEDHEALNKAQQILACFKENSPDFTAMFKDTEENARAILFYVDKATQFRLRTTIPLSEEPHVPDTDTLQSLLSPQHLVSLLVSELRIHASTNRTPLSEMKDQIHKTVEKWIAIDLRAMLEKISRATSRPVDNSKYNKISIKYASGIAGYDVNNDLMRFVKSDKSGIDPANIMPIAERIFSKNAVDRYHVPSYSDICRRFAIAEEFRNNRSSDGQAHRIPEDSVQWCLSSEFLECFICPPDFPMESTRKTTRPHSVDIATANERKRSSQNSTHATSTTLRRPRKLKGTHDSYANKPPTNTKASEKTSTTRKRKKAKAKGPGRGRKRKSMHSHDSNSESDKQADDSKDILLPDNDVHLNQDTNESPELDTLSTVTNHLPQKMGAVHTTTSHTGETDILLPSLSLQSLVLHSEFQHQLSQRNIACQAILNDGSIVRHGPILPKMNITSTIGLNNLSTPSNTAPSAAPHDPSYTELISAYRSPHPGDIVSETEAKYVLGFPTLTPPINATDSPFAMNSIFVSSIKQIENFQDYISQLQFEDPSQSGYFEQEYTLFGYGGEPVHNQLPPHIPPQSDQISTCNCSSFRAPEHDQKASQTYNRAILQAMDDRRMVSLWFPIIQPRHHMISHSQQEQTCLIPKDKYFVFMGMYVVKAYTYRCYTPSQYTNCCRTLSSIETKSLLQEEDDCSVHSLRFLLCNHFRFSLLPTSSTINAHVRYQYGPQVNSILSAYETQLIRPHKEAVVCYDPNDIVCGDDPQLTTEIFCIKNFFKCYDDKSRTFPPPLFHHDSFLQSLADSPAPLIRRILTLNLIKMIALCPTSPQDSLRSIFDGNNAILQHYVKKSNQPGLRSMIQEFIKDPPSLAFLYSYMVPSCLLVASPYHSSTMEFIKSERLGHVMKLDDESMRGLSLLTHQHLRNHGHYPHLKTVDNHGQLIHYHAFSSGKRRLTKWDNLQDISESIPEVSHFVAQMTEAARIFTEQPDMDFTHYANFMGNILTTDTHRHPQTPHCDTHTRYRSKSVNQHTGQTNVCTFFAPMGKDGTILCVWPPSSNTTSSSTLSGMKLIYIPYGYALLLNGCVIHAGGIGFGLETVIPSTIASDSDVPSLYSLMTNPRLQAFIVPRSIGPCESDDTHLVDVEDISACYPKEDMQKLLYNLCNGSLLYCSSFQEVKLFD